MINICVFYVDFSLSYLVFSNFSCIYPYLRIIARCVSSKVSYVLIEKTVFMDVNTGIGIRSWCNDLPILSIHSVWSIELQSTIEHYGSYPSRSRMLFDKVVNIFERKGDLK